MLKIILVLITLTHVYAMVLPEPTLYKPGIENIATTDISDENAWLFEGIENTENDLKEPDPLEPLNRVFYYFDRTFVDGLVLQPAAILYRDTVHDTAKKGVENFVANAFTPLSTVNHILQGEGARAFRSIFRFVINSTVGIFGLMDAAKEIGLSDEPATFNQTMASWGVETGPYVMLPFFGPSSFRGTYGMIADVYLNPVRYYVYNNHRRGNRHRQQVYFYWALYGLDIVDRRSKLLDMVDDIDKTSKDPYVSIRNYYFQQQRKMEKELKEKNDKDKKEQEERARRKR